MNGVYVDLICSRNSQKKVGSDLLKLVEEKAKENNVKIIRLESIYDYKLRDFYLQNGYNLDKISFANKNKNKPESYIMSKFI